MAGESMGGGMGSMGGDLLQFLPSLMQFGGGLMQQQYQEEQDKKDRRYLQRQSDIKEKQFGIEAGFKGFDNLANLQLQAQNGGRQYRFNNAMYKALLRRPAPAMAAGPGGQP